jgi:hypothetical protein
MLGGEPDEALRQVLSRAGGQPFLLTELVPLEYSVMGLTWGFQLRSWRSAWDHRG